MEPLRWLDSIIELLQADPAAKLMPNVLPSSPLDNISKAKRRIVMTGLCLVEVTQVLLTCSIRNYTGGSSYNL